MDSDKVLERYCEKRNINYHEISDEAWERVSQKLQDDINTYEREIIAQGKFDSECFMYLKQEKVLTYSIGGKGEKVKDDYSNQRFKP